VPETAEATAPPAATPDAGVPSNQNDSSNEVAQPASPPGEVPVNDPEAPPARPAAPTPTAPLPDPEAHAEPTATETRSAAADAAADERNQSPGMLSVMGKVGFVYSSGLGASLRYRHTIVPDGWLRKGNVRDELGFEGGVDYMSYTIDPYDWTLSLVEVYGSVTWNVWLTEKFAVYPRAGLGYGVASLDTGGATPLVGSYSGIYGVGGLGALYDLGGVRLRIEIANRDLNVGAAMTF